MSKGSQALVGFSVLLAALVGSFVFILIQFGDAITEGDPDWASDLILECAAVGLIAMALIQTARSIFPVRGWFQRRAVVGWLDQGLMAFRRAVIQNMDGPPIVVVEATSESVLHGLVGLTSTNDTVGFFDLPIEKLCGQISVAAEHAFDRLEEHPALLVALVGRSGVADAIAYIKARKKIEPGENNELAAIRNRTAQECAGILTSYRSG